MRVTFLGCGDAFGSGGRFNTCFMVDTPNADRGGLRFLIDCGATSLVAMKRQRVNPDSIDAVFLTHLHGDHFGGLPFLLLQAAMEKSRAKPLTIAGPAGVEQGIRAAMEALFPGSGATRFPFPLDFVELEAGAAATVRGVAVEAFRADHVTGMRCFSLRLGIGGKTIAYTGDTAWGENVMAAGHGADLLIAEAYFFDRVVGKHMSYVQIDDNAEAIGAKRIILTHMSEDMLGRVHDVPYTCAEDGLVVEV
jgi:ribonuclease BN (tRNA processing enzyme)